VEKILLPTDGSPDSEKALAIAWRVAQAQNAELVLARVVEPLTDSLTAAGGEVDAEAFTRYSKATQADAEADLTRLGARVASTVRERIVVLTGPVEQALLDCEEAERPDLVVLATHGRRGLARLAFGSVADRLVRDGVSPVLLVRRSSPATAAVRRALIMLDGSALAEQALGMARELAGRPLTSIVLYRAVSNPNSGEAIDAYLASAVQKFDGVGVELEPRVGLGVRVRDAIEAAARDVDLIILSTHGRGGFDRIRHGSVAEFVLATIDKPLLLVRATG
jgi:nucleotide-binding universal stress UspA family protein